MQLLKLCKDNGLGMRIHWCGCECVDWGWGLHVLVGDMVERIRIYDPPTQQPWSTACSWTLASCSPVFHIRACPPSGIVELTKTKTSQKEKKFRQLYSNSWPCSASQASKGRWKPITYNTCFAACGQPLTTLISSFPTLCQMMNSMATHRYSPYSLPSHTASPSTLQPSSYTSSSLLPSTQGISNSIQVLKLPT